MTKDQIEYGIISNAIDTLSLVCFMPKDTIIKYLTGILWDKEEAKKITDSSGKLET